MTTIKIDCLISRAIATRTPEELALGFLRYEALRKLNARQYGELIWLNLAGENFDGLIDEIVVRALQERGILQQ